MAVTIQEYGLRVVAVCHGGKGSAEELTAGVVLVSGKGRPTVLVKVIGSLDRKSTRLNSSH